jgi:hypothetical protein
MSAERVREILATLKPLATEYYQLTGKPLGVTGEIAEYVVAEAMGLELAQARMPGYDALRRTPSGVERIQIKGRVFNPKVKANQRLSCIGIDAACDTVLFVLLDDSTLEAVEIWEAPYTAVAAFLAAPGSKTRGRGALSVREFKRLARRVK